MNKILIGIVVLIVGLGIIAYVLRGDETAQPADNDTTEALENSTVEVEVTGTSTASSSEETGETDEDVVEFTVSGTNYEYSEEELTVQEGQTVRITFKNTGGMHDFVIDEFEGARTEVIQDGEEETIEFVADEAGSFAFYCSVGQHRALGMEGTLIVEASE